MASGFFLGGAAEGIMGAEKQALAERTQTEDTGIRNRALSLQENIAKNAQGQEAIKRADELIANTMGIVSETIKQSVAVGRPPDQIEKAVTPLLQTAQALAAKVGRNPEALAAQVKSQLFSPDAVEAAKTTGRASATAQVESAKVINKAEAEGVDGVGGPKEPKDKIAAEGALRDDYLKQAAPYITMRDAKNRLDNLEKTGAGDMALVFQFMKILDPGSTVREGEYATASNSGGVPSAIQGLYNKALGEGTIGDKARKEILAQANKMYQSAAVQHDKLTTQFAGIAKRQGLNPKNVLPDLLPAGADEGVTPGGTKFRIIR